MVEDDRAIGVRTRDGKRYYADHVVSTCDGYTTVYGLLGGRYTGPRITQLYQEMLRTPKLLYPGVVSAFVGFAGDTDPDDAHSTTYLLSAPERAELPGALQDGIVVQLRSRYAEGFAPPGKSVIHCTYFSDFDYWQSLRHGDRREYRARKRAVVAFVRRFLERQHPGLADRIEVISVATPTTTERFTGNHNGSILAWKAFSEADDLANKIVNKDRMGLPGLRGFSMAGQWVGLGGLVRAASSGRFVVQYVCAELGLPFRSWESQGCEPWDQGRVARLLQHGKQPVAAPARAGRPADTSGSAR
jgi:phytoene dehydrogenase-like protein